MQGSMQRFGFIVFKRLVCVSQISYAEFRSDSRIFRVFDWTTLALSRLKLCRIRGRL